MVSVGVCNQQFQGTDYTFNGLWLPGAGRLSFVNIWHRFLLVRFLLVCYKLRNAIHRVYLHDQKIHLVSRSKTKKQKNTPNTFPFFVMVISDRFFNVLVTFPNVFSSTKTNPKNNTPPIVLFHSRKKKWPGKRRIFQSTFTKPKGIVQPMVGVFFSIKNTIIFGRNPSSSRGCEE